MKTAYLSQLKSWDDNTWDCLLILNNKNLKSLPVVIRAAKDAGAESRWQLLYNKSTLLFRTFGEVRNFCRERGWM